MVVQALGVFLGIFTWVLSSRFQCLLMAWGGYG